MSKCISETFAEKEYLFLHYKGWVYPY